MPVLPCAVLQDEPVQLPQLGGQLDAESCLGLTQLRRCCTCGGALELIVSGTVSDRGALIAAGCISRSYMVQRCSGVFHAMNVLRGGQVLCAVDVQLQGPCAESLGGIPGANAT